MPQIDWKSKMCCGWYLTSNQNGFQCNGGMATYHIPSESCHGRAGSYGMCRQKLTLGFGVGLGFRLGLELGLGLGFGLGLG
jgi:hypothetical protein